MKSEVKKYKFTCLQCSRCCRNTITPIKIGETHFKQGIHLFPNEAQVFRRYGSNYGVSPRILPKWKGTSSEKVIAYQLVSEPCPFLSQENTCQIYEKRPLACQLYPRTSWGEIDKNCSWVRQHGLHRPLNEEVSIVSPELNKAFKKVTYRLAMQLNKLSEKELILYDSKGKKVTIVNVNKFLSKVQESRK